MASDRVERRLAAILCADVVGYSRLMGDDEEATLRTLTDYREIMRERIEAHGAANAVKPASDIWIGLKGARQFKRLEKRRRDRPLTAKSCRSHDCRPNYETS